MRIKKQNPRMLSSWRASPSLSTAHKGGGGVIVTQREFFNKTALESDSLAATLSRAHTHTAAKP